MCKTNEVRPIDANALLEDLQELLNQEVLGNTVSDVGNGIGIAMQKTIEMQTVSLNTLRDAIYEDAVAHGLWESTDYTVKNVLDEQERDGTPFDNTDEVLRSWAMEPIRKEVNELEMASESEEEYAEELADVIITSLSVAGKLGIDIDAAVRRKMEINRQRPWKHGKEAEHEIRKPL